MTDKQLFRWLWGGVALAFPFFSVSFFRLDVGIFHLAVPMLFVGVILAVGGLRFCLVRVVRKQKSTVEERLLVVFSYSFFVWHLFAFIQSENVALGGKEVIKLAMGVVCFWGFFALFPQQQKYLERFWNVALWSSSLLLAFLVYKYAFVFKVPFLGTNIQEVQRFGKNQLAWYLAMLLCYAIAYVWGSRHKLLALLPTLIILVSLIYAGSRSSWLSAFVGMLGFVFILSRRKMVAGLKVILVGSISLILGVALVKFASSRIGLDLTEVTVRFVSIFNPDAIPDELGYLGKHSYEVRGRTIELALQGFTKKPIVGVGLTNTVYYSDRITHNDYVAILLELGLVGEWLFLGILAAIYLEGKRYGLQKGLPSWVSLGARSSFMTLLVSLMFINIYTSLHFWVFLALYLLALRMEKPGEPKTSSAVLELSEVPGGAEPLVGGSV